MSALGLYADCCRQEGKEEQAVVMQAGALQLPYLTLPLVPFLVLAPLAALAPLAGVALTLEVSKVEAPKVGVPVFQAAAFEAPKEEVLGVEAGASDKVFGLKSFHVGLEDVLPAGVGPCDWNPWESVPTTTNKKGQMQTCDAKHRWCCLV